MSGDIPPLPHVCLWHLAYISTGTKLFYVEMANELLQRSENLYKLDQKRKKNSALSFIFEADYCKHRDLLNLRLHLTSVIYASGYYVEIKLKFYLLTLQPAKCQNEGEFIKINTKDIIKYCLIKAFRTTEPLFIVQC